MANPLEVSMRVDVVFPNKDAVDALHRAIAQVESLAEHGANRRRCNAILKNLKTIAENVHVTALPSTPIFDVEG